MKTVKKKLGLNKITISSLNGHQLNQIVGGEATWNGTCNTCEKTNCTPTCTPTCGGESCGATCFPGTSELPE